MSLIYKRIIKFFLFLGITSFLFWLVYRDQNWSIESYLPGLEVAIAHGFYGLSDSFGK